MANSKPRITHPFFAKLNPDATVRSVARQALLSAIIAAGVWGLSQYFRAATKVTPTWTMFIVWIGCAAVVGAVWEWQMPGRKNRIKGEE